MVWARVDQVCQGFEATLLHICSITGRMCHELHYEALIWQCVPQAEHRVKLYDVQFIKLDFTNQYYLSESLTSNLTVHHKTCSVWVFPKLQPPQSWMNTAV